MNQLNDPKRNDLKSISPDKVWHVLVNLLSVFIPFLLFAVALALPLPVWLLEASRFSYWWFGGAIAIVLFLTLRRPGYLGRTLSLSAVLLIFALPLARLWQTGASELYVLGGLLPLSDAAGYYTDARNILAGGTLWEWSPQRPLFPGLLAVLLGLTQQNLQVTLAALVAINAIACFFLTREIQKTHGTLMAVLVATQTFFFYRLFIGKASTENLGLAFGLLGFAALWQGAHQRKMPACIAGIFLLTFALNARIGTVFVLPALVLWGALRFRQSRRFSAKFVVFSVGAILLGGIANLILLKVVGLPNGSAPFSNFSFTLYGIMTRTNWSHIYQDYPELWTMDGVERTKYAYAITTELIRQNPFRLVTGIFHSWADSFIGNYSVFAWDNQASNTPDWIVRPLAGLGLLACLRYWKTPTGSLLLAMAIGMILTIPILPLWDSGIRPYAATIAVLYTLSALGATILLLSVVRPLIRWLWQRFFPSHAFPTQLFADWRGFQSPIESPLLSDHLVQQQAIAPSRLQTLALFGFGFSLVILSFAAPIPLKLTVTVPQISNTACPAGLESRVYRVNPGSSLQVVSNDAIDRSRVPTVRIGDFKRGLKAYAFWPTPEKKIIQEVKAQTTILDTQELWLVASTADVPKQTGTFRVCGKPGHISSSGPTFFYAESFQAIAEARP